MMEKERTGSPEAAASAEHGSAHDHDQIWESIPDYNYGPVRSWIAHNPFLSVSLCFSAGILLSLKRKDPQATGPRLIGKNKSWVLGAGLISGTLLAFAGRELPEPFKKSISKARTKVRALLGGFEQEEIQTVSVEVYLPQEDVESEDLDRLLEAVAAFMDRAAFELESEDLPIRGSLFKKLRFQTKKKKTKGEVKDALEAGKEALQDAASDKKAKENIQNEFHDAAQELINRLKPFKDAVITINEELIILKVTRNGREIVMVESMSSEVLDYIRDESRERHPLALYELIAGGHGDTEAPPSRPSERPLTKKARSIYNGATTTLRNIMSKIVPAMAEDSTNGTARSRAR